MTFDQRSYLKYIISLVKFFSNCVPWQFNKCVIILMYYLVRSFLPAVLLVSYHFYSVIESFSYMAFLNLMNNLLAKPRE